MHVDKRRGLGALVLGVGLLIAPQARGAIISGEFRINGSVTVTPGGIADINPAGGGNGVFVIDPFTDATESFDGLEGTTGNLLDLDEASHPVGVDFSLPNWLTFNAAPGITFELTHILPGIFGAGPCTAAPAAGQQCTPLLPSGDRGPFNLTNDSATSSSITIRVRGNVTDGSGSTPSTFVANFTTLFVNRNLQDVLNTLATGGSLNRTFAADIAVTPIPEPSTASILAVSGIALVCLGAMRRRAR